jgi:SPP1 family predicted phage head-tail adaptor
MSAGLFKPGYEIWRYTETVDDYGNPVQTWNKLADVEGRAYPRSAVQEVIADINVGVVKWIFACPADTDITEGDEVRFDGRALTVEALKVTSTGRRYEAECGEVRS